MFYNITLLKDVRSFQGHSMLNLGLLGIWLSFTPKRIRRRKGPSSSRRSRTRRLRRWILILVAIAGVYQIVEWQMEPWMALLFGVGQVISKKKLKNQSFEN